MDPLEKMLKALANKRRLAILRHLKRRRASVGDVAAAIKLSFSSTSNHLAMLANAGVIEKRQESLVVWHHLPRKPHAVVSEVLKVL